LPRYKSTGEALRIISNKEQIRNFGVIAHVDHGKCIDGDSLVTLTTGEMCPIKELYANQRSKQERVPIEGGLMVDSMNPGTTRIEDRPATAVWNLGSESLVEVLLEDGRCVRVTPEHPFYSLSSSGFLVAKEARNLRKGDSVAVAGVLKSVGSDIDDLKGEILSKLAKNRNWTAHPGNVFYGAFSQALPASHSSEKVVGQLVGEDNGKSGDEKHEVGFKLSELVDIAARTGISAGKLYDMIDSIEYDSPVGGNHAGSGDLRLPKTIEEFRELFYLAGRYCARYSTRDLASGRHIELGRSGDLSDDFLRIPSAANGNISKSDGHLKHTLFRFFNDIFGFSGARTEALTRIPRVISISRNELLAWFLRGLFDMHARVDPEKGRISFVTKSKILAEEVSLLLLRFGVSAIRSYRGSRYTLLISGKEAFLFVERIGSGVATRRPQLESLTKGSAKNRQDPIPIGVAELKTVRVVVGLDSTISEMPDYRFLEKGQRRITPSELKSMITVFERQLTQKEKIREKALVLEFVSRSTGKKHSPLRPPLEKHLSEALLDQLKADGLVKRSKNTVHITPFGKDVLNAWRSIISGDDSVVARIQTILMQWKALSEGEVKFRKVRSVEARSGVFSVYDLTVPETHTYIANGIIVHNTTTSDSLLAACGMLSPSVAGQALALDYMPLEQQRQMTIKAANVTLYYEHDGTPYVFNMIDTPGHIDFTGKVTRSLRAIDGAVVVVDSVEGVMTQTETVTRQALEERVRPVLYINKIDRLVKELRLTPDKMLSWLANIIGEFNNLVNLYAEPEFRDKWKVSIQDNSVAFGSSKDKWGFNQTMAARSGIKFKDVYDAYTTGDPKTLAERSPLHEAILTMVIKHHPPPHVAQGYRIPKIWKGDLNSDVGKALLSCDENGPTVMMVTNVVVDPQAGIVATGRLFSGTVRDGDSVYLLDAKREGRIQSVNMYMGNVREMVGALPAGNIPALLGLEYARSGETLSSVKGIVPFEGIKYVSEPVVTVAIEAKNPRDLPKLVDALQKMHIEDPNLIVKINEESGETLLSGMGVLHLEIATTLLQDQGLDIVTSQPLINYRETIQTKAGPIMSKSPNRHNKIYIRVEPLPEEIIAKIRSGEISETADRKGIAKMLRDMGWDSDEARSVAGVDDKGNMLLDQTKGVQFMQESMDSIRAGFDDVMNNGPLAYEYCRGVKVVIHHFVPHEDPAHRTYAQLMPAARRAILGAMLLAQPVLLEPIQGIEVKCGVDQIGDVTRVLSSKRGKLLNIDQKEVLAIVEGEIPAAETFDLSEVMRGATAGKAVWNIHFKSWNPLPVSLQKSVVTQVRKRKGLPEEVPPPTDFIDTE
jgi:elongation factor 2